MKALLGLSKLIDSITAFVGKASAWLVLAAVLISAANATSRYAFGLASNAWLDMQWYLYGAVFFFAAAYTLQRNEHVRIDFVSNMLTKRTRDWIDLIGHIIFLLPFTALMAYLSWPWAIHSFMINEQSLNAGGLVVWPAKFIIPIGFTLLCLQAVSEIIKRAAVIAGQIDEPYPDHHELPPVIEEMESGAPVTGGDDK